MNRIVLGITFMAAPFAALVWYVFMVYGWQRSCIIGGILLVSAGLLLVGAWLVARGLEARDYRLKRDRPVLKATWLP